MARLFFYVMGVLLGAQQQCLLPPAVLGLLLALAGALLFLRRCAFYQCLCCFVLGLVWLSAHGHWRLNDVLPPELHRVEQLCEGRVVSPLDVSGQRWRFEFRLQRCQNKDQWRETNYTVRTAWYRAPADAQLPRGGERWRFALKLKQPRGNSNPGGFDRETWMFQRNFKASAYVSDASHSLRLRGASWWSLAAWREWVSKRLQLALPAGPHAAVIPALILADRSGIEPALWQRFRDVGTAHLLAISGLHVGLIAAFGAFLGRLAWYFVGVQRGERCVWVGLGSVLAAGIYAALAGFSLPTVRALFMLVVAVYAVLSGRHRGVVDALLLAFLGLLIVDPLVVLSAGFWLSFASVAAIVAGLSARRHWRPWQQMLWINGAMGLVLAPLSLLLFGQLAWWCSPANLLVVPVFSLTVVPLSLLGGGLAVLGAPGAETLLAWAAAIIAYCDQWQAWLLSLPTPALPLVGAAPWGLLLLSAVLLAPALWRGAVAVAFLVALLLLQSPRHSSLQPGAFAVTTLDVGHGLAVLVETQQHLLIYDTGPRYGGFNSGSAVVAPALRRAGWLGPEMIVLSHDDRDHAGGLAVLRALYPQATLRQTSDGSCLAGQRWGWDGVEFEVLHPLAAGGEGNNSSCVLRISSAYGSALLSGDIEQPAEARMLRDDRVRRSDLLLVPHHGSKSSSTAAWLAAVQPGLAVISVDQNSRWQMPHEPVLQRLAGLGVQVMSTADAGAIRVQFDASARSPELVRWRERKRRFWHLP